MRFRKGLSSRTVPDTVILRVAGSMAPLNLLVGEPSATDSPRSTSLRVAERLNPSQIPTRLLTLTSLLTLTLTQCRPGKIRQHRAGRDARRRSDVMAHDHHAAHRLRWP